MVSVRTYGFESLLAYLISLSFLWFPMEIDLSGKKLLIPFELCLLVTGCKALWVEDRYMNVVIRGNRSLLSQLDLLTRWISSGIIGIEEVL